MDSMTIPEKLLFKSIAAEQVMRIAKSSPGLGLALLQLWKQNLLVLKSQMNPSCQSDC